MKRVKAACIFQTLVFSQKAEAGFSAEHALRLNREEVEHYKAGLAKTATRHQIVSEEEQQDGSIVVHVRKQYNGKVDVNEYFV